MYIIYIIYICSESCIVASSALLNVNFSNRTPYKSFETCLGNFPFVSTTFSKWMYYPSAIANPFSAFYFLDIFHKIARIEALRPKTTLHRTRTLICSKHFVCTFEFEIYPLHCDFMKVPLNATLIVFRFWCQLRSVERALEKINIATWH